VLGGALFSNVVAALSAAGFMLWYLGDPLPKTHPDWAWSHPPLGGFVLLIPYLVAPLVAFFVGMSAGTLGQEGSLKAAKWTGIAMVAMAAICLVTGPWAGPLPLMTVAYLLGAIVYLYGVRLCRRADEAPGW
jgi:Na+/H+-dicarboxylate symporter